MDYVLNYFFNAGKTRASKETNKNSVVIGSRNIMIHKIDSEENINEIEHPTVPRTENRKR